MLSPRLDSTLSYLLIIKSRQVAEGAAICSNCNAYIVHHYLHAHNKTPTNSNLLRLFCAFQLRMHSTLLCRPWFKRFHSTTLGVQARVKGSAMLAEIKAEHLTNWLNYCSWISTWPIPYSLPFCSRNWFPDSSSLQHLPMRNVNIRFKDKLWGKVVAAKKVTCVWGTLSNERAFFRLTLFLPRWNLNGK